MTPSKDIEKLGPEGMARLKASEDMCAEHKVFLAKHIKDDPRVGEGLKSRLLDQVAMLFATPAPMVTPADGEALVLEMYTYEDELYEYLSQPLSSLPAALHSSRVTEGLTLPSTLVDTAIDTSPLTGKTKAGVRGF